MNKFLRIVVYLCAFVLVFLGGFWTFIQVRGIPKFEALKVDYPKVEITPERVAKGAKIAGVQCIFCHKGKDGKLSGKLISDLPPEFGEIHSANITQSKEHGIATWTDGEIATLLRTGLKRDGQYAPIYMPKYPHLSDEDVRSVIAWLRSGDAMVQASEELTVKPSPSFLTKFLCLVAFKPLPYPSAVIPDPDTTNPVVYGKYLVQGRYDCWTCHSQDFKTLNFADPALSPGYCGGGNMMLNLDAHKIYTANITPDEKTGIGSWTEDDFMRSMKECKRKDGKSLRYPMLPYNSLTDLEVKAIWQYLRTVPKLANEVDRQWDKDI